MRTLTAAFAALLSLAACDSGASADGALFSADATGGAFAADAATWTRNASDVVVVGSVGNPSGADRQFTVKVDAAVGTHTSADADPLDYVFYSEASLSRRWAATSASPGSRFSVTITELTETTVRGTFTATLLPDEGSSAAGTVTVTNGRFNVTR